MIENSELTDVKYDERFLEKSWGWFQDCELRLLTDTPKFTLEKQIEWYKNLSKRDDYFIRGIKFQLEPIGAFGIKNIIPCVNGEYWGYIGDKRYWGMGIGRWMLNRAVLYGQEMGLGKLHLRVIRINQRAIALYQHCGFIIVNEDVKMLYMSLNIRDLDSA